MSDASTMPPLPEAIARLARVIILSREGCCLCDEARDVAQEVCGPLGVDMSVIDVDGDPALRSAWNDHVPVTFVDGRRVAMWTLGADQLTAALELPAAPRSDEVSDSLDPAR